MKKVFCVASLLALMTAGANALETSVAPTVTSLQNPNPETGLYVGNSFTYYNCGVNGYVRGFTKEEKRKWSARMITISAGRLSTHEVDGYLKPHPADGKAYVGSERKNLFDVVFLQAQSREPYDTKTSANYRKYLKQHIESVRRVGSEPIVVVTWATQDHPEQTKKLADATIQAANDNHALALPVGLAFAESLKNRPDLILHNPDKKHPSAAGSYLYGAVVYSTLFKKSPEGFEFLGGCEKPLKPEDAQYLQNTAWNVVKSFYGWQ